MAENGWFRTWDDMVVAGLGTVAGPATRVVVLGDVTLDGAFSAGAVQLGGEVAAIRVSGRGTTLAAGTLRLGTAKPGFDTLAAVLGGQITVTDLILAPGSINRVVVDGASSLAVGGTGRAGTLSVAAGARIGGAGALAAGVAIVNDGIIAAEGGVLALGNAAAGAGRLTIGDGATLVLGHGATTNDITFLAPSGTLRLSRWFAVGPGGLTSGLDAQGLLHGFGPGDVIDYGGGAVTEVEYRAGPSGLGTLTLRDGVTTLGTLRLEGDYAGLRFVVAPAASGGMEIVVLPVGGGSVRTMPDKDVVWVGPAGGPVRLVDGPAASASLTLLGGNALSGRFETGRLTIGDAALATLTPGTVVTAASASLDGGTLLASGAGTALTVAGALTLGGGTRRDRLQVIGGAAVRTGALSSNADIVVDATSALAVGAGEAGLGTLTVGAGGIAELSGTVAAANGIVAQGSILVAHSLGLFGAVSGAGALRIGAGAFLSLASRTAGSARVSFEGPDGTLQLGLGLSRFGPSGWVAEVVPQGVIAGFAPGDTIRVDAAAGITAATFKADGPVGVLTLWGGSGVLGRLDLAGSFGGQVFRVASADAISITVGPRGVASDLDGDGASDLLWRDTGGTIAAWTVRGGAVASGAVVGGLGDDWRLLAMADVNGDGRADLLWQQADTGVIVDWTMQGAAIVAGAAVGVLGPDWTFLGAGDLNGDGTADLLWQQAGTGVIVDWTMQAGAVASGAVIGGLDADWAFLATADLDGDGRSDLLWQQRSTGLIVEWAMDGARIMAGTVVAALPDNWQYRAAADFDGDGRADLLWQDQATGMLVDWTMAGATITSGTVIGALDPGWSLLGAGDYNGDGRADLMWRNGTGTIVDWTMRGATIESGTAVGSLNADWSALR